MKKISILLLTIIFSLAFNLTYAITPSLSLSATGSGDSVRINVTGDPGHSVLLKYTSGSQGLNLQSIGSTDSTGNFTRDISTVTYSIVPSSTVAVLVNNQESASIAWPSVSVSQNNLTLSQTGVVLSTGQSSVVTANSSSMYLSNNSNSQVANININGSQITITGNTNGSTVATICTQGTNPNCSSIYVTVQTTGTQALSFSQSNITIAAGQTIPVTISGGTGQYMVSNNPNSSLIQANISGSIINLSTTGTSGSSSITICSTNMASCGIINVNVASSSSSSITFSQNSPVIPQGQTTSIVVSGGGSASYYVSSNSNNNIIQTTLSGNTLTLHGLASGSSIITVCSSLNSCNTLTATVNYISTGGTISLSQSSITLMTDQTLSVSISGGDTPYNLPQTGGSIFQATLNGNILNIKGLSSGSKVIPVCSAGGGCINLSVTVSGTGALQPTFSQSSISLIKGQSGTVNITNPGSFYISNNSNSNVASSSISGNVVTISALNSGNSTITVCQTGGQCSTFSVTITAPSSTDSITVKSTSFVAFSNEKPVLSINKSTDIALSGGQGYSVVYNSNPGISRLSISNNALSIVGLSSGTSVIVICSLNGSACGALSLKIEPSSSSTVTTPTTPVVSIDPVKLNPIVLSLEVGKISVVAVSGGDGTYKIDSNSDSSVASAFLLGKVILVAGKKVGFTNISVCSNTQCTSLPVGVYIEKKNPTSPAINTPNSTRYIFKNPLFYGDSGDEVRELQKRLISEGVFSGSATGYFGDITLSAVRDYQKSKGISQTGNVGEETLSSLNK